MIDLIPEDGDDISHPNVFSVGNIQSPTLGQIRKVTEHNIVRKTGEIDLTLLASYFSTICRHFSFSPYQESITIDILKTWVT
jgi:hypothetical protein